MCERTSRPGRHCRDVPSGPVEVQFLTNEPYNHSGPQVSPDGKWAVASDFRRLNDTRPGYGYSGIADPRFKVLAPEDTGLFRVDLATGKQKLLDAAGRVEKFNKKFGGDYFKKAKAKKK